MADEASTQPESLEHTRWLLDNARRDAERAFDREDAILDAYGQAAISAGTLALRSAMWINGGAAVTVLSFIGGLVGTSRNIHAVTPVADTLIWFAAGAGLAVVGMALSYLVNYCAGGLRASQKRHWEHPYIRPAATTRRWQVAVTCLQWSAVAAGALSLLCFILGVFAVHGAVVGSLGGYI
jgi:hypothetical protein